MSEDPHVEQKDELQEEIDHLLEEENKELPLDKKAESVAEEYSKQKKEDKENYEKITKDTYVKNPHTEETKAQYNQEEIEVIEEDE